MNFAQFGSVQLGIFSVNTDECGISLQDTACDTRVCSASIPDDRDDK